MVRGNVVIPPSKFDVSPLRIVLATAGVIYIATFVVQNTFGKGLTLTSALEAVAVLFGISAIGIPSWYGARHKTNVRVTAGSVVVKNGSDITQISVGVAKVSVVKRTPDGYISGQPRMNDDAAPTEMRMYVSDGREQIQVMAVEGMTPGQLHQSAADLEEAIADARLRLGGPKPELGG